MSMLMQLGDEKYWRRFYDYKASLGSQKQLQRELAEFIGRKGYKKVISSIKQGEKFPLPAKAVINKTKASKKRVVYSYPTDENMVLKLLTYLLLRKYDGLLAGNLYSFRPHKTAKDAVVNLIKHPGISECYSYKADISNYFNSIPIEQLLPMLKEALADEPAVFGFLSSLLSEPNVIDKGRIIQEQKGIMAGTPVSAFYANLYLMELDKTFEAKSIAYARYSDDIIVFGKDEQAVKQYACFIHDFLKKKGLVVNPDKETFRTPEEGWDFLGFACKAGSIDISPVTVHKLKAKMRRKTNALKRWYQRNELSGDKAARAFIRIFNKKLLLGGADHDLTWSRWFFPVINTTRSLEELDHYAQDCIRFLLSGTHTKARFNVRYDQLKSLGYQSLVHAYYEEAYVK